MPIPRRDFLAMAGAAAIGPLALPQATMSRAASGATMYGLIGKMTAVPGQRDALAAILLEGTTAMPGCLSYIVATDPADPDGLWVTEVWDSQESHRASLQLPAVQAAIGKGRPLIAGFSNRVETAPIGGYGLPQR
ncbi:MAG TPA: putative quinol monooxygenase [Gemmatimonadales bacterium]|nr:putative quinol monooxygenase [Gemmatimonadales bacterium]